jgi:threonine synthase
MVAAQADAYAPIARAFAERAGDVRPWEAIGPTVAGGIADPLTGYEKDGTYTLRAIRQSGGWAIACSDEEILSAVRALARDEGILSEPTGAVGIAALPELLRQADISPDDTIVCLVTGHGLKQVHELDYGGLLPEAISPTLDALGAVLARMSRDALEEPARRGGDRRGVD